MKTRELTKATLFFAVLVLGLAAITYGGVRMRAQAREAWLNQANQDVTRITETGQFWLSLIHTQLRGVGSTFYSSSSVTQEELYDALEVVEATESAIPVSELAFVVPTNDGRFQVTLSTDAAGPLATGSDLSGHQAFRQAVTKAMNQVDNVIMGPAFEDPSGRVHSLFAFAAPNGGVDGVLVTTVDLSALIDGLYALHIPEGVRLRLVEIYESMGTTERSRTIIGGTSPPPETVHTFKIVSDSGHSLWDVYWDIMPSYSGGPATQLANVVQLGGTVLLLLVLCVVGLLTRQNTRVSRLVSERTAELQASSGKLSETLENSEELRREADRTREDAEAANRAKSKFLTNISHEIRTPMNAILGFAEILSGQIDNEAQKAYLSSIQSSGKALLSLLNDILDLSRVEAGRLELEYGLVDVSRLFNESEGRFSHNAVEKGLNFRMEIDSELPHALLLDGRRLHQILVNLVSNAIKFTDAGHVSVSARAPRSGNDTVDLIFDIRDTGIGVPKEQQESIFGTFEQREGQSVNKYGGTGLGLAMTKHLVELMKGEISVRSEVNVGSTFTVVLRGVEVASADDLEGQPGAVVEPDSVRFEPATILVADDVVDNREIVKGYLAPYGFDILEVSNGAEAIEVVKQRRPDLVLMDIQMPVMDGYKATHIIKADSAMRDLPVVALTASVAREKEEEIEWICDGFLKKPIEKSELVRAIAGFLPYSVLEPADEEQVEQDTEDEAEA